MPLVAIDSMVVDIITNRLDAASGEGESTEALLPPPEPLAGDAYAMYWLLALAPYWRSCAYTFSDTLYRELLKIPPEKRRWMDRLLAVAQEIREEHPVELRVVNQFEQPTPAEIIALGIADADAEHIADAVRLRASHFLTCDRRLLRKGWVIEKRWGMTVVSPTQFLISAVRSGAPWPATAPWPWELPELVSDE